MSKVIIDAQNVTVSYQGNIVLNNLTFQIEEGDVVALIGPNGSGKTTLVRTILGLVKFSGTILLNGKSIQSFLNYIGYVPQQFDFDHTIPITVEEFLSISYQRVSSVRINQVLQEVDMLIHKDQQIGTLSGGQLQRILIARALIRDPKILLLDEPISGVDMAGTKTFYEIVSHLNEVHNTTVVLVSHEVNMVYQFASKIICLNRDLICYGKPKETITKEVLERLYGKDIKFQEHEH